MITLQEARKLAELTDKSIRLCNSDIWHGGQKPVSQSNKDAIKQIALRKCNKEFYR